MLDLRIIKGHGLPVIVSKLIEQRGQQRGRELVEWTNDGHVTLLDGDMVAADLCEIWNVSTGYNTREDSSLNPLVAVLDCPQTTT